MAAMTGTYILLLHLLAAMPALVFGTRPNIVLMMADDLGIGDIGCFGNDTIRTPNIDRLAAEGVRLKHDLATAAICTPSRSAFQTGRYAIRMGMVPHNVVRVHLFAANSGGMPSSEITIGEVAKSQGYETAFIGKWHLGVNCHTRTDFCHHPLNQGYEYFYGMPVSNAKDFGDEGLTIVQSRQPHLRAILASIGLAGFMLAYALRKFGLIGNFLFMVLSVTPCLGLPIYLFMNAHGPQISGMVMRNFEVVEQPIKLPGFTDRLIAEGVRFLTARQQDEKPFLLVLSWIQVHTALHAISPFRGRSAHGRYGDEVEEMDWSVGQILAALDRLGLADNTFVHFTSDHGGHLEEKGLHGNQEGGWNGIYKGGKAQGGMEGGIRVPTVIRWPAQLPGGSVIEVPTSHMDIHPTVARLIGGSPATDRIIDGTDILPLLKGDKDTSPPHEFLVHYCGDLVHATRYTPGDGSDVYKAFYATHKHKPGTYECHFTCLCNDVTWHDPPLLYNVARDPSEERPLDTSLANYKAIIDRMQRLLDEHRQSIEPVESQFRAKHMLPLPWLQVCCNAPYCRCKEDVPDPQR